MRTGDGIEFVSIIVEGKAIGYEFDPKEAKIFLLPDTILLSNGEYFRLLEEVAVELVPPNTAYCYQEGTISFRKKIIVKMPGDMLSSNPKGYLEVEIPEGTKMKSLIKIPPFPGSKVQLQAGDITSGEMESFQPFWR